MKISRSHLTKLLKEELMKNPKVIHRLLKEDGQRGVVPFEPGTADGKTAHLAVNRLQGPKEFMDGSRLFLKYLIAFKDEQATVANLGLGAEKAALEMGLSDAQAKKFAGILKRTIVAAAAAAAQEAQDAQAEAEAVVPPDEVVEDPVDVG